MQNGLKSMNGVLRQNPALYQQIKALTPIVAKGFASDELVAKNYIKFKQRYTESVKSFQDKMYLLQKLWTLIICIIGLRLRMKTDLL